MPMSPELQAAIDAAEQSKTDAAQADIDESKSHVALDAAQKAEDDAIAAAKAARDKQISDGNAVIAAVRKEFNLS